MSPDRCREACNRSVTRFMIRYLEKRARAEMIRAYALFFNRPDGSRDDGETTEAAAIV